MTQTTRDDDYYMTLVTLQVEDCLFRVPRHTLESQSKIFRDMFSVPPPSGSEVEGSSDENPIRLEGIKKDDFKCLMKILFSSPLLWNVEQPPCTYEQWFPVIKLSKLWEFNEVHGVAIGKIPYASVRKPAVEKVALAFQYDIKPWLLPGLNELAQRREPINVGDVGLLGLEVALKVAAVRESLTFSVKADSHAGAKAKNSAASISNSHSFFATPSPSPATPSPTPQVSSGPRDASAVDFMSTIKKTFNISDIFDTPGPLSMLNYDHHQKNVQIHGLSDPPTLVSVFNSNLTQQTPAARGSSVFGRG